MDTSNTRDSSPRRHRRPRGLRSSKGERTVYCRLDMLLHDDLRTAYLIFCAQYPPISDGPPQKMYLLFSPYVVLYLLRLQVFSRFPRTFPRLETFFIAPRLAFAHLRQKAAYEISLHGYIPFIPIFV